MDRLFIKRRAFSRLYRTNAFIIGLIVLGIAIGTTVIGPFVFAKDNNQPGSRVITVHDQGVDRGIMTDADTLREAFDQNGIVINPNDHIEPAIDDQLDADVYDVNIYRARAITVVDGSVRYRIDTPYQTPKQITADAGLTLYDEDQTALRAPVDPLVEGSGLVLDITRATPVKLDFFGKNTTVRTMAKTVGELLDEKNIHLEKNETSSLPRDTKITANMKLALWRNGEQTITKTETINFQIQTIEDADKPASYHKITTAGEKGEKEVTYKVTMRNGKELKRKAIHSVTTKKPKKQVEVVGTKFNYTGGKLTDKQINALGQCESGMTATRNSGNGFYGAFQFMPGTWSSVAPEGYKNKLPHEAPLDVQKQAVQNLLSGSNIHNQFPSCASQMSAQGII